MDWSKVSEAISETAPAIGALLAPATGGVSVIVGGIIAEILGTGNEPDKVLQALKNNPDALIKIKQLESDERIKKMQIEIDLKRIEADTEKAYLGDKSSARGREIEITKATGFLNAPLYVLAAVITLGFFGFTAGLMISSLDKTNGTYDIVLMLAGALAARFGTVVDYFFGASKTSGKA